MTNESQIPFGADPLSSANFSAICILSFGFYLKFADYNGFGGRLCRRAAM